MQAYQTTWEDAQQSDAPKYEPDIYGIQLYVAEK